MNKVLYSKLILFCLIVLSTINYSQTGKYLNINKVWTFVSSAGNWSETGPASDAYGYSTSYYDNFPTEGKTYSSIRNGGYYIGVKNWSDSAGNFYKYKVTGAGPTFNDYTRSTIPIPQKDGYDLHVYRRFKPPAITVDGVRIDKPLFPNEIVAPEKIPGTADVMIESFINIDIGITIRHRVFAWSQKNHDDYFITEFEITNSGNVDKDEEIELPNQTLDSLYFLLTERYHLNNHLRYAWGSKYGQYPDEADSLRILYAIPEHRPGNPDFTPKLGQPSRTTGYFNAPIFIGRAYVHVDKNSNDQTDDITQPSRTGYKSDGDPFRNNYYPESQIEAHKLDWQEKYLLMDNGMADLQSPSQPYMEGTFPNTFHSLPLLDAGYYRVSEIPWIPGVSGGEAAVLWFTHTSGPWDLAPGESITIAVATSVGTISKKKSWEIGPAWLEGNATYDGEENLPDLFLNHPENGTTSGYYATDNDKAKDNWIMTGKDSLFQNAWNAQWNTRSGYNAPIAPPPPSIEVLSLPDKIRVNWGSESESASDFAGYRVYRAKGYFYYDEKDGIVVGDWQPIFECGAGTDNALTNSYDDAAPERGQAYYYAVRAFDDGVANGEDARGSNESLESGFYYNRTILPAHLTKPAGTLSEVRVVPNPFNVSAAELQYIGEPDKILFLNLPVECQIRIYTETGDLVKVIDHLGSGDESWGVLDEEHLTSTTGQKVASGIYIAYIVTPNGDSAIQKFVIVR